MQIKYSYIVAADCTSDPHLVRYSGEGLKDLYIAAFKDIIRVLESDLVFGVRHVELKLGDKCYKSDYFDDEYIPQIDKKDKKDNLKKLQGVMFEKHKVSGLYFCSDFTGDQELHLPPGLTGAKEAFKLVSDAPVEQFVSFTAAVVWTFAGASSCADDISMHAGDATCASVTVDYSSQDWWRRKKGYLPWCKNMEHLLGMEFSHA